MKDYVWALSAVGAQLRKRHTRRGARWETQSYDQAYLYGARRYEVASLRDLHDLVNELRHQADTCIVRARLSRHLPVARGVYTGPPITRRLHPQPDGTPYEQQAWWRPADHHWLMVDMDSLPRGTTPEEARAMLPVPFRRAACVWHYSGSHGVSRGTRLHLFFWLRRRACDASLRSYFGASKLVDKALFSPVQIHYTADPEFAGAPDPVPERLGWLDGAPDVDLPGVLDLAAYERAEAERTEARAAAAARSREAAARMRPSVDLALVAAASAPAKLGELCERIERAAEGDRHRTINGSAYAAGLMGAPADVARSELAAAATSVLPPERWDEAIRTVADGYAAGTRAQSRSHPLDVVRPDPRRATELPLDQLRDRLRARVRATLREGGRLVLATSTGSGKSTIIAAELADALADDAIGSVTIATPTRALAEQWQRALPGASLRPTRAAETDAPLGKYRCERHDEYRAAQRIADGAGKALCDACWLHSPRQCPYIAAAQRTERGDVMIVTHHYAAQTSDWRDVVIIDESPLGAALVHAEVTPAQYALALQHGDVTADSTAWPPSGSVEYHGAYAAAALGLLGECCDPALASTLAGWADLAALAEESTRGPLAVDDAGVLRLTTARALGIPDGATVIAADATSTAALAGVLYGEGEYLALAAPREARVVQFARSLSRQDVGRGQWATARAAAAWQQLVRETRARCERPLWVLVRAMLEVDDVLVDLEEDIEAGRVTYYRGPDARGANDWPDIDGVVLADWHPRGAVVRETSARLAELDGVVLTLPDAAAWVAAWSEETAYQLRDAEVVQAAGRLRGAGTIIFASVDVLESLPPDEVIEVPQTQSEVLRQRVRREGVVRWSGTVPRDLIRWRVSAWDERPEVYVTGDARTAEDVLDVIARVYFYPREALRLA